MATLILQSAAMDAMELQTNALGSTKQDLNAMAHMGKKRQLRVRRRLYPIVSYVRLLRNRQRIFGFLPTLALSITLLASWEAMCSLVLQCTKKLPRSR